MSDRSPVCVLLVADQARTPELTAALPPDLLSEKLGSPVEVIASSGADETLDLFAARTPHVVVVTATLEAGDSRALVEVLRGMVPRASVAIVVVGDDDGPIRTVLDAADLAPERFVNRPLAPHALQFAVASACESARLARGSDPSSVPSETADDPTAAQRAEQRARWEALADAFVEDASDPGPPAHQGESSWPPAVVLQPRRAGDVPPDADASLGREPEVNNDTEWSQPVREPTLILRDPEPAPPQGIAEAVPLHDSAPLVSSRSRTDSAPPPAMSRTRTEEGSVRLMERGRDDDKWSEPVPLAELPDRESKRDIELPSADDLGLPFEDYGDDIGLAETGPVRPAPVAVDLLPADNANAVASDGRDFARQLRAKMSMMAQRLFQGADQAAPPPVDLGPRHDHSTEIDLAALGEEPALGGGVTEIETRSIPRQGAHYDMSTSPGSWDSQVRDRGLPDTGEIVRGVSDAAMLFARVFAQAATGRVVFRRGDIEKTAFFDQGRPVFGASNQPGDRMGELLVREGKITASQYERCQTVASESGRRMGEILVSFGYLKRRELLPAVRRHVEDIVYSLFGWDRGMYRIELERDACAERIRLSRHPAAMIMEGIRRKLDRTNLERLLGPPTTVIEIPDRDRIGNVINLGDLATEERAALAAFDGHADIATVARLASVDVADVLPFAWGLCVLGLAHPRRPDTEVPDDSPALIGETDLAIDRERVRARWQLVADADYFAVLGVRRDATGFEIRRAYQSARRDFASDCFPPDLRRELAHELDEIANVLDEAFRVLRDDRLRLTYLANLVE
ncbi:MAG: DUF4388 domain-containing protein [Kofleriaceae bacterium]